MKLKVKQNLQYIYKNWLMSKIIPWFQCNYKKYRKEYDQNPTDDQWLTKEPFGGWEPWQKTKNYSLEMSDLFHDWITVKYVLHINENDWEPEVILKLFAILLWQPCHWGGQITVLFRKDCHQNNHFVLIEELNHIVVWRANVIQLKKS